MVAKISVKGQTVIPEAVREQARIKKGDELDVGYVNGLIIMRKRKPISAAQVSQLLLAGKGLPIMTAKDENTVARVIQRARKQRRG